MNNIDIKVNPYFWFSVKNLEELKFLIEFMPNNEYALSLIEKRLYVLKNITETSSYIEKATNEPYPISNFSEIDPNDLIKLIELNLKIVYKKISAVIITFNEERCINRCIDSIINIFDEIVIVDTGSTDNTVKLIKNYNNKNIKLYNHTWKEDFSEARNFAKSKAKNDWIFFIDADEYINDNKDIKLLLNSFNSFPLINSLVMCPALTNPNEYKIITLKRIFTKSSNIDFFGKIHEEPRKKITNNYEELFYISLDIDMQHDGYLPNIVKSKNKLDRNMSLLKEMLSIEPDNPRWTYFLVRDGLQMIEKDALELMISNAVLIDINNGFVNENLKSHEYTFALLDILAQIKLMTKDFNQFENILALLNVLMPENSNAFYYSKMSNFINMKDQMKNLLVETIKYRQNNFTIQPGMLHSNGYHIDFLIALFLFETGKYKNSIKYFDFLEGKYSEPGILKNYKEILDLKEHLK